LTLTIGKRNTLDMTSIQIRPLAPKDRAWAIDLLTQSWGSAIVVSYGKMHDVSKLPGMVAVVEDQPLGLAMYRVEDQACELVTLNSLRPGLGIGSNLVEAVAAEAKRAGCMRLWLVTTNDNLKAMGFYQRRGFKLIELRVNAIVRSRELKPEIPLVGEGGIPISDELVLARPLD
jgi:ribosomal protein S18 acetylase RimI-like enzyme